MQSASVESNVSQGLPIRAVQYVPHLVGGLSQGGLAVAFVRLGAPTYTFEYRKVQWSKIYNLPVAD